MRSTFNEPGWQHGPYDYKLCARWACPALLPHTAGLGSAWLVVLKAHPLGQAPTAQSGPQREHGHHTPTLAQMGTALRMHKKGRGLWGQDTGWVRQQNTDRRSLEHISTSPSHGWGCLPQALSLTWWCHYEQHVKKGTGFPKEERGGKKNKSLKCLTAAEAGKALKRARYLVHPWWRRGRWASYKHIPSP